MYDHDRSIRRERTKRSRLHETRRGRHEGTLPMLGGSDRSIMILLLFVVFLTIMLLAVC